MKAEEAKAKTVEAQNKLVEEQLKTVHRLIQQEVSEGGFSISEYHYRYSSTRSVGWLDEVVESLRGDGYKVRLVDGTLTVSWGDTEVANEEPRLLMESTTYDKDTVGAWTFYIILATLIMFGLYMFS